MIALLLATAALALDPIVDGRAVGPLRQVADGFTSTFVLPLGDGSVALFDAGVDLAGRAWIVAALGEGVLEDRLYALAANPRRTRNFYEPNAVLREPNDSSRLLWLVERLSAVDFGAHTRARHAFPVSAT